MIVAALATSPLAAAGTIEMTVHGMVCGFCTAGVEKALRKNPAIQDVVISLEHRLVAVATKPGADISDDVLRKTLKDSGYDVKAITRTDRSAASIREQVKAGG
jgi:mercuric ion binding protein